MSTEQDEGGKVVAAPTMAVEVIADAVRNVEALMPPWPTGPAMEMTVKVNGPPEPPMLGVMITLPRDAPEGDVSPRAPLGIADIDAASDKIVGDAVPYSDAPVDFAIYATETFPLGGADGPPMGVVTAVDREAGVVTVGSAEPPVPPEVAAVFASNVDGEARWQAAYMDRLSKGLPLVEVEPSDDVGHIIRTFGPHDGWRARAMMASLGYRDAARESTGLARWEAQAAAEALRKFAEEA